MYAPPQIILRKYAEVLVDFAVGKQEGIKKDDVVYLVFDAPALPLGLETYQRILEKGGHPIVRIHDEAFDKILFKKANKKQLLFFPKKYQKALIDTYDHLIYLIADDNPFLLRDVSPQKIMLANKKKALVRKWRNAKEDSGKLTWTLCLYGTTGLAKEAGLTLERYWEQIIKACYLDTAKPVEKWHSIFKQIAGFQSKLNKLNIQKIHLKAKDTDLWIKIGEKRKWLAGGGNNIPSFEIFTSPDWRGTEGKIFLNHPLYRYGNIVQDIHLEFMKGKIVKAKARKNNKLLQELIKQGDADKIGEFSLTDKRLSKIDKFMATTLFDENFGGRYGNTHIAIGTSFHDAYRDDPKQLGEEDWEKLGFNESLEHSDIISTTDRIVEAELKGGKKKIIYKNGQFTL